MSVPLSKLGSASQESRDSARCNMSGVLSALLLTADEDDLALMREKLGLEIVAEQPRVPVRLMTSFEAAEAASVSVETIRRHVDKGTLNAKRSGSRIRIHPDDLEEWLDSDRGRRGQSGQAPRRTRAGSSSTMRDALVQLNNPHSQSPSERRLRKAS